MREQPVNPMGCLIGVFFCSRLKLRLFQGTMNKTVFGIHDGCLRVIARLFLDTCRSFVALVCQCLEVFHALLPLHVFTKVVEYLTVVL